ncbi:MarR family winged helix-turn-helix transcriptional regulator [Aestuariivirga sp.]|uniref:MarR family winged helix-turn-helix transcriptional regulator n=1 Tax=Aestuariivirga sp. TaxID=2650926 RepID=UPI0039E245B9
MNKTETLREAGIRIVETARAIRLLVEQRLRPYGMTRVQYSTLARLARQDGQIQTELAEGLEVQPIAMVRVADQLSAEGLIERRQDPADRRCNRLYITAAGQERIAGMDDFKEQLADELFDGVAETDIHRMMATLDHLHRNLKIMQAADETGARARKARAS